MPDDTLELHLRRALDEAAGREPLAITVDHLERGLARRRRERTGRRIAAFAVATAAVVVIGIVAVGNGWLRLPSVGTSQPRDPIPVASADPGVVEPGRPSLGGIGDVVVVHPIVDPTSGAGAFDVGAWPVDGDMRVLARYSGIIGADVSPNVASQVSPDGYLALPFAGKDDLEHQGVAIYDLFDESKDPIILTGLGSQGVAWSPDGRLALFDDGRMTVVAPTSGERTHVPLGSDLIPMTVGASGEHVWAADGSGVLGWHRTDQTSGDEGLIGIDGTFRRDPAPALFTPSGLTRDTDAAGLRVQGACRGLHEATGRSFDCTAGATSFDGRTNRRWADLPDDARIVAEVWDHRYVGAWLLLERFTSLSVDTIPTGVDLVHVDPDGTIRTVMSIANDERQDQWDPALLGISSDDGRAAIRLRTDLMVVVDMATGAWSPIGGGWDQVAGWAEQRGG